MKRWLLPEEGTDQMMDKIAVEQLLNALPQELQIWVPSHNPGTAAAVAQLIESYDSAHIPLGNRVGTRHQDHRPSSRPFSKNPLQQGKQKSEGSSRNIQFNPIRLGDD